MNPDPILFDTLADRLRDLADRLRDLAERVLQWLRTTEGRLLAATAVVLVLGALAGLSGLTLFALGVLVGLYHKPLRQRVARWYLLRA